ncbi:LacI family transcriptional regulator [Exilibacterium tricleocarpae]|uniref:LacI family transcriptional regulator n=2 Tax=Exilibacterium tricleocarpae TaxID=2591008 RepID=A0A545TW38_9GAMM|nr:LacI family transcriptional regulator [Exilibacterium tricleocarpae]
MTESGKRVTSYDVARVAGVSQSAVSRCFKPGASVSKKMRDKVMTVARELGFQPNAIARSLITRRSNMVAVIINNFTNLYYPELLVQLSRGFDRRGVHVLLFTLEQESDVDKMLDQVWQYQVDGVISAARLSREQVTFFEERGVPLVFYNRALQDFPVSAICCNQEEGERLLVNRLHTAGHRSFGVIGGPTDSVVSYQRTHGALDRLRELGVKNVPVVEGDYSYDSGRAAFRELLQGMKKAPDAVICANDVMAIGCMDAARHEFAISVPEALSVVGFDGTATGAWSSYRLTTIDQPLEIMAEAAVNMLLERVENPELPPEQRTFSGVLLEGESARLD